MPDSIETLLHKPSEQWTFDELRAGFVAAIHRLNQAGECIAEHDKLAQTLRDLLSQYKADNEALLTAFIALQSSNHPPTPSELSSKPTLKRSTGRPPKASKADLSWVCDWYLEAREKYGNETSDTKLIYESFAELFEKHGRRRSAVNGIKSQLNTFRTEYLSPAKGILEAKGLLRK